MARYGSLRAKGRSVPVASDASLSDARLAADLQLLTLGLRLVGLEGFASGQARIRDGVLTIKAGADQ